jgi:hypothetical protein
MQEALVGEASACGFLCVRSSGFESSSGQVVRTHNPETEAKTFSMVRGVGFAHQLTSIIYPIADDCSRQMFESRGPPPFPEYALLKSGKRLARKAHFVKPSAFESDFKAYRQNYASCDVTHAWPRFQETSNHSNPIRFLRQRPHNR